MNESQETHEQWQERMLQLANEGWVEEIRKEQAEIEATLAELDRQHALKQAALKSSSDSARADGSPTRKQQLSPEEWARYKSAWQEHMKYFRGEEYRQARLAVLEEGARICREALEAEREQAESDPTSSQHGQPKQDS